MSIYLLATLILKPSLAFQSSFFIWINSRILKHIIIINRHSIYRATKVNDPILDLQKAIKANTISWTQNQISITNMSWCSCLLKFKKLSFAFQWLESMINSMTTEKNKQQREKKTLLLTLSRCLLAIFSSFIRESNQKAAQNFKKQKKVLCMSNLTSCPVLFLDSFDDLPVKSEWTRREIESHLKRKVGKKIQLIFMLCASIV